MKMNLTLAVVLLLANLKTGTAQTIETLQAPQPGAGKMLINTKKMPAQSLIAPVRIDPKTVAVHRRRDAPPAAAPTPIKTGIAHAVPDRSGNTPWVDAGFKGNTFNNMPPPDNNIAISDDGHIVSVANSSLLFAKTDGTIEFEDNFSDFLAVLNLVGPYTQPKVLYDPVEEKFIFVVVSGNTPATSQIVIGFSTSSDPNEYWWFYVFSGDPEFQDLWFDAPSIGISANELFIAGDQYWVNNTFWQALVYQLDKGPGFKGQYIPGLYWWAPLDADGYYASAMVPLSYGFDGATGPGMYLVSTYPDGASDGMLYYINDEASNNPTLTAYKFDLPTFYPPYSGIMKGSPDELLTSDCRILSGYYADNTAYFVFNSRGNDLHTKIMYCRLNTNNLTPATISIGQQPYEYAYPSVAPFTTSPTDKTALIGFLRTGGSIYPQFCMGAVDASMKFSGTTVVKEGESYVDADTVDAEEWGRYTGIARRHSAPGVEVWISGSYGAASDSNATHVLGTWIARVTDGPTDPTPVTDGPPEAPDHLVLYPNPVAAGPLKVGLEVEQAAIVNCSITDAQGKLVSALSKYHIDAGKNELTLNTAGLAPGVYYFVLQNEDNTKVLHREKFLVQ